jgi:hypothetical protein
MAINWSGVAVYDPMTSGDGGPPPPGTEWDVISTGAYRSGDAIVFPASGGRIYSTATFNGDFACVFKHTTITARNRFYIQFSGSLYSVQFNVYADTSWDLAAYGAVGTVETSGSLTGVGDVHYFGLGRDSSDDSIHVAHSSDGSSWTPIYSGAADSYVTYDDAQTLLIRSYSGTYAAEIREIGVGEWTAPEPEASSYAAVRRRRTF